MVGVAQDSLEVIGDHDIILLLLIRLHKCLCNVQNTQEKTQNVLRSWVWSTWMMETEFEIPDEKEAEENIIEDG